ncbi:MAG: hypothetical protein H0X27_00660 [Caulobacteraceae bacterium]|nr:hypothetical protein [Caulobacteraceae bacterium]
MSPVDLTVLNLRVPVVDAVCATACGDWLSAADLWFETFRDSSFRGLAARCGAEAALQAGLLDLAEYFYVGLRELPDIPEDLGMLRRENEPVRRARLDYFQRRLEGWRDEGGLEGASELMSLRFYREVIRRLLVMPSGGRDLAAVAPLLARAYARLGAHASLLALWRTNREGLAGTDVAPMVSRAERLFRWQSDPPLENVRRFERAHPAGPALGIALGQAEGL